MTDEELWLGYYYKVLEIIQYRHGRITTAAKDATVPTTVVEEVTLALLKAELDVALAELKVWNSVHISPDKKATLVKKKPTGVGALP